MNQYEYNYITGAFSCSNVGKKYNPWGSSTSNYSWSVEFTSVRMSGTGYLAQNPDGDGDNWKVGIDSNRHPFLEWRSPNGRNTYTYSDLSIEWGSWFNIKYSIVTNGASPTVRCTVYSTSQDIKCTGRWTYNVDKSLTVGSSATTIRDTVTIKGYPYSNTLATATFALDSMTQGATSVTVDGYTYSCPAIQHYSDPAPTVTIGLSSRTETSLTITASANYTCNKWEYSINNGSSYTTYSTTSTTSTSYTITGLTKGTTYNVKVRATKVGSGYTGVSATGSYTTLDLTPPTVSVSLSSRTDTSLTIVGSANVTCNKWEYSINNGSSYTAYSTASGTSASYTITGLSKGTTYNVKVRATRSSNSVTGVSATGSYTTTDSTPPTVSASTSSVTANSFVLSVSANVTCNKWEYSLNGGSYVSFSTTSGTSASYTITGLSPATTYSVVARATRSSNNVTGTASTSASTLGFSTIATINNTNTGSKNTFTFYSYSSSFYFRVQYKNGSTVLATENIGTVTANTTKTYTSTYAFPHSLLPSSTSATITATLYTYSNSSYSTLIGSNAKNFTLTVPSSIVPTISAVSITPYNSNTWLASKSYWVGGFTQADFAISATAGSGSSVKSIVTSGDIQGTSASFRSPVLSAGTKSVTVTVADNRGRTATWSHSWTVQSYSAPSATIVSATRGEYSGGVWTESEGGDHIRVVATGAVSLSGNACTLHCKIGSNAEQATSGTSATWYATNTDAEHVYQISVWATDSVGTVGSATTATVSTAEVPLSWNDDRIGVGGVPQTTKTLEVAPTWRFVANGKNNVMGYMPYSFVAYGTEGSNGFARIATINITGNGLSSPFKFEIVRRIDGVSVTLYLLFNNESNTDPALKSFYYDSYAGTVANHNPDAFAYKSAASTWDIYVRKSAMNDFITVITTVPNYNQSRCNITYTQNLLSSIPSGAVMATQLPLANTAKNNTMAYMPYSYWGTNHSGATGYAKVATFTFIASDCYIPIEIKVNRMFDYGVQTFYFRASSSGVDPANVFFYADYSGVSNIIDAFVYKTAPSTWEMYVLKRDAWDVICARVFVPPYDQQRVTVTYTDGILSSVPSGAVMASPVPYSLGINNAKTLIFNIASGSSVTIKGSSECAWLLGCTGWNSTMRRGLWWISGYSDSSRADVIYMLGNYTNSQISISAVSGSLAWTISNTGTTTALMSCLALYGALPTIT